MTVEIPDTSGDKIIVEYVGPRSSEDLLYVTMTIQGFVEFEPTIELQPHMVYKLRDALDEYLKKVAARV